MQNSMVVLNFSLLDWKHIRVNLVQKIKIINLS